MGIDDTQIQGMPCSYVLYHVMYKRKFCSVFYNAFFMGNKKTVTPFCKAFETIRIKKYL